MEGSLRVEIWERVFSKKEFISANELRESLCPKDLNRAQNTDFVALLLVSRLRADFRGNLWEVIAIWGLNGQKKELHKVSETRGQKANSKIKISGLAQQ